MTDLYRMENVDQFFRHKRTSQVVKVLARGVHFCCPSDGEPKRDDLVFYADTDTGNLSVLIREAFDRLFDPIERKFFNGHN